MHEQTKIMSSEGKFDHFVSEHPLKITEELIERAHIVQQKKYEQNNELVSLIKKKKSLKNKEIKINRLKNCLFLLKNQTKKTLSNNLQQKIIKEYSSFGRDADSVESEDDLISLKTREMIYKEIKNFSNIQVKRAVDLNFLSDASAEKNKKENDLMLLDAIFKDHKISYRAKKRNSLNSLLSSTLSKMTYQTLSKTRNTIGMEDNSFSLNSSEMLLDKPFLYLMKSNNTEKVLKSSTINLEESLVKNKDSAKINTLITDKDNNYINTNSFKSTYEGTLTSTRKKNVFRTNDSYTVTQKLRMVAQASI